MGNYLEKKDYNNETIHEKIEKIVNLSDKIDTENEIDLAKILPQEKYEEMYKKYKTTIEYYKKEGVKNQLNQKMRINANKKKEDEKEEKKEIELESSEKTTE